jgi:hydrogenase-1 operon protein HyaF
MSEPVVMSLLAELSRHLERLARTGETAAIDLRSLPVTPDDRAGLEAALGRGEVCVTVESGGRSELLETGYPGLWWVRHLGAGDNVLTERIEIAPVPEALAAAPADIAAAAARLAADLAARAERESSNA